MRIVLDTDPGVDDAFAIFYLAAQPDVELVAVGSVHGNVPAPVAADNALRLLDLVGLTEVPVAVGAREPLVQPLHTAEFVHGPDGLGGHAGPLSSRRPVAESAAEQLVRLARAHPAELTVVALGPLTNIALATMLEPTLPRLVKSLTVMGGAVTVPGNITPYADANTWHDPEATDIVLRAGFDLTLVGLDVTETARADFAWLNRLAALDSDRARYAHAIVAHYADLYATLLGEKVFTLHDPLAAALTVDPALATHRELVLAVELTGTHTRGQIVADLRVLARETNIESSIGQARRAAKVVESVQSGPFLERLLAALA
ncbi:purine nucleosidase [Saccharothrix variisporea]|uniref:Purine nucleosidase n=1 Tax=Saccharothrix variisporea TaxID=543527 RepID=A0A495XD58_9PSEU|nr:nucleoside hydrolase [Saccharothrix variisporea]RKT69468.1 purine nucleosidase [Saccharothrix variisporea]